MELAEKLKILSAAAKYDVSCSSSGSRRANVPGGVGSAAYSGICHSWTDDGRCVSLLKILFSNECLYNCAYCVNRISSDTPRATFTPEEVADLTINFYRRNYIEGLFLSSAIYRNENYTMELLLKTVKKLRHEYNFNGYIHLKAIPGADLALISEAGKYADRMSVNIELPSEEGLKLLAPRKKKEVILKSIGSLTENIKRYREERKVFKNTPTFVPAGQSTQLIVGATPDSDLKIMRLSETLYKSFDLKRVYYSAYVPVSNDPKLPRISSPPLVRENRLYQADWLLRFYGFSAGELLDKQHPNLDLELDPKASWALRNLHLFPVEINTAEYRMLLRVPGIGVTSAKRIAAARKVGSLGYEDLKKIGVVLKRARYFITCRGKYFGDVNIREDLIKNKLVGSFQRKSDGKQLTMFNDVVPYR
ncbi:MAG: putative DNA modification/repair radical SAM protein [Desulfotomaculum sp.]|nr:putative DNA modification/repair radical SAM protein [Desulfotomaculum sp.]